MTKRRELTESQRLQVMLRYQKILSNDSAETVKQLADEFKVARDYPARLYKEKTKHGAVLSNKRRSGRPTVLDEEKLIAAIREKRKGSSRAHAKKLGVSHHVVLNGRKKLGFIGVKTKPKPVLNAGHMLKRLADARKNRTCTWKNWVFADFKWFNLHRGVKKAYYRPGSPRKNVETQSRHFLPKLMFYSVISKSATDGKIGLYVCANQIEFKRGERKGEERWVPFTVDNVAYHDLLRDKVFPDIKAALPGVKEVTFRHDNAKPHVHQKVKDLFQNHRRIKIINNYQPAQSPDFNPNDLGVLKVIADRVEDEDPQTLGELVEAVQKAWDELPKRHIVAIIDELNVIMEKTIKAKGGNRFRD